MLQLTNSAPLTLAPGASVTFDTVLLRTGCDVCHRKNSGLVQLNAPCARYEVEFSANIGATAVGLAQLAIALDGETLGETIMDAQTAAAGNLNNVASGTIVRTCCRGADTITVKNVGTTTVNVANANLRVGRWS